MRDNYTVGRLVPASGRSPIEKMIDDCVKPIHTPDEIANAIIYEMERVYPNQMKSASGGFKKTLRENIIRKLHI